MRKKLVLLAFALAATTAASLLTPTPAHAVFCANGYIVNCGDTLICCPNGQICWCP
jgi:hypothetical protein